MKRRTVERFIVLILFIIAVVLIYIVVAKKSAAEHDRSPVMIEPWNSREYTYAVCYTTGEKYVNYIDNHVGFHTDMTLDEMIATNPNDYLCTKILYSTKFKGEFTTYLAAIFYNNNNYYVLYESVYDEQYDETSKEKPYIADILCAKWNMCVGVKIDSVRFPLPELLDIGPASINIDIDFGDNRLNVFFDHHTLEDTVEFYSRLDSSLYSVDYENRTITVKAYIRKPESKEYFGDIIIDFNNRTFTGPASNGLITIDGKEKIIFPELSGE